MELKRFIEQCSLHHRGISPLNFVMAVIVGMALGMMGIGVTYAQETPAANATLIVEAPAQVAPGGVVTLRFRIEGDVEGNVEVGGFEAMLLYPRTVGEFAAFSPAAPLGEQGVGQLVAPELPGGSAVGFYTCATAPCLAARTAQVQAAAEAGFLAEVELLALTPGQMEIKLGHVQLVDRTGQPIAIALAQPSIVVQVGEANESHAAPADTWAWQTVASASTTDLAAAADVTQDGAVAHSDLMETALSWQIVREGDAPCSGAEAAADINGDGCIDIIDVQLAAAFASGDAPTVGEPHQFPEQLFLPQVNDSTDADSELTVQAAAMLTFTVNSTLDEYDKFSNDNKCLSPSGVCTLRAAIQQANNHAGVDVILFSIPVSDVATIQIGSRLPSLWDSTGGTIIKGYSQPGASPNTDPLVSNAQIKVQVRGNGSEDFDGMAITSAGNVVEGLSFYNLKRSLWVYGTAAQNNVIAGNFLGTDAAGLIGASTTSLMQAHGINLEQGAKNNRVGGTQPGERNVISGNARHGIGVWHFGTNNNLILNNIVGLSPDGTRRLSNRVHGIDMNYSASNNIIGGVLPGERNLISGNNGSGAEVSHGETTTGNVYRGNYIGTTPDGNSSASYTNNGNHGISLKDRVVGNLIEYNVVGNNLTGGININNLGNCCVSNNVIQYNRVGVGVNGGTIGNALYGVQIDGSQNRIGPGNIIANNPVGIQIDGESNDGNTITQNSIFGNVDLGIDLAPFAQVNLNDVDDVDTGPNEQLNFPVLEGASTTVVTGTACANCTIELFIADSGEGVYGEGRSYLASTVAGGDGAFSVAISGTVDGDYVTATATDSAGNTSEFSLNKLVGNPLPVENITPRKIEAEDYKVGGSGVGYFDTTPGNSGKQYRTDDVDIEVTQDVGGGYDVGWIAATEWLAYDITVTRAATYQANVRVATPSGSRKFHLEIDGNNVTGSITIPWTGGWQNWVNVPVSIPLTVGSHVLRFVAETDKFNINYIEFTSP